MPSRTRSRASPGVVGSFSYLSVFRTSEPLAGYDVCKDITPAKRDQYFDVMHRYYAGAAVTFTNAAGGYYLNNFTPGLYRNPTDDLHSAWAVPAGRPTDAQLAVSILARTNPGNSYVDVPTFVVESIKDLPISIYRAGRDAIENIYRRYPRFRRPGNPIDRSANSFLWYQFGLLPLVSDVKKLLDFERKVQNRVELLRKLQTRSILRKVDLWDGSAEVAVNTNEYGNSSPIQCLLQYNKVKRVSTYKVWGYARYTPSVTLTTMSNEDIRQLAINAVLGLNVDFVTSWELLPWSWLADWFSNIGEYLKAHRNVVPCSVSQPVICETGRTEEFLQNTANNSVGMPPKYHNLTSVCIKKNRRSASAALPSAYLPLLTQRQVGILTSLAALRRGR